MPKYAGPHFPTEAAKTLPVQQETLTDGAMRVSGYQSSKTSQDRTCTAWPASQRTRVNQLDAELVEEDLVSHLCIFQHLVPAQNFNVEIDVLKP